MTKYPNVYDEVIKYFPDLHKLDDGDFCENNGFRLRHMTMDANGHTIIAEIAFPQEYYQFWVELSEKEVNVVSRTIPGAEKYLGYGEPLYEWVRIANLFEEQLRTHCIKQ